MKFRQWIRLVLATAAVSLTGCAVIPADVYFDRSNAELLKKTYVDPKVQKPASVALITGSPGVASIPLASILTTDNSPLSKLSIQELLEKEKIDIGNIVYDEAQKLISQKKSIGLTSETTADAVLKFVVDRYSFSKTHPFGKVYDATIRVTASLVTRDGKLIWRESDVVSGFEMDNDKGQPLEVYYSNPETLRVALTTCTRVALKRLLARLPDEKAS